MRRQLYCSRLIRTIFLLLAIPWAVHAQDKPIINEINPKAAVVQLQSIAIHGSNLVQSGHTTTVTVGGVPANTLLELEEMLILLVPAGATNGPIVVSVDGEESDPIDFTVITSADHVDGEVIAELLTGAHIGRVLAKTELDLLDVQPIALRTFYRFEIPDGRTIPEVIQELAKTELVYGAWANFIVEAFTLPSKQTVSPPPNDPMFAPDQYGPQRIHAVDQNDKTPDAHRLAIGTGKVIAVLDTGVDHNHEDLKPGKVIKGWDWINDDADPDDDHYHGTHVAGIAAALTNNNNTGIVGIAPASSVLSEKVLAANGKGSYWAIANGIRHAAGLATIRGAANPRADVINLSLGGSVRDPGLEAAVKMAVLNGSVVVAASGNVNLNDPTDNRDRRSYPAAYSNNWPGFGLDTANGIITVANSTEDDAIYAGIGPGNIHGASKRGLHVDVAAPGHRIMSTVPDDKYSELTGTSMSAPHVSGVVALMLEADGNLAPWCVECILELTSHDLHPRGFDIESGHGRVNAYAAVHAVKSLAGRYELLPPECKIPPKLAGNGGGGIIPGRLLKTIAGRGFPDQVVPITSNSQLGLVATIPYDPLEPPEPGNPGDRILKVNLTNNNVTTFNGKPVSDVVITTDDQYAIVSEFPDIYPLNGELRRIMLATNMDSVLDIYRPRTEITLTPDAAKALVGTVNDLAIVDMVSFDSASTDRLPIVATTGISVTPNSGIALVGDATDVRQINLNPLDVTNMNMGIPVTGISISENGRYAVYGIEEGVVIVDLVADTRVTVAGGVPVSNIALTSDNQKAVYATTLNKHTTGRIMIIDLDRNQPDEMVAIPVPVTDVDVIADSQKAVVGTEDGVSVIDIPAAKASNIALPQEVVTGISLSPTAASVREKYAAVGTEGGVAVIDIEQLTSATVAMPVPVTNISCPCEGTPHEHLCVVGVGTDDGNDTAIVFVDLSSKTASMVATSTRPLVAATISDDGQKGLMGTKTGVYVLNLTTKSLVNVSPTSPILNALPDDTQPPLNPSGERGKTNSTEG